MKEDPLLLYADVVRIIRSKWKIALGFACCMTASYFFLIRDVPIQYLSIASFKEVEQKQESGSLGILQSMFSAQKGVKTTGVMTSRKMVGKVIQRTGEQVVHLGLQKTKRPHLKQQCFLDLGIAPELPKKMIYSDVTYLGSKNIPFFIRCQSENHFLYKRGDAAVEGVFGVSFTHDDVSFTLNLPEGGFDAGKEFAFVLKPLDICIDDFIRVLEIYPNTEDPSIIELEYIHADPLQGNQILKTLMNQYQSHLVQENARMMTAQLTHLNGRFSSLGEKFEQDGRQFSEFLKEHQMLSTETTAKELSEKLNFLEKEMREDEEHRLLLSSPDFTVNAIAAPCLEELAIQFNDFLSKRMSMDINSLEDEKESVLEKIFGNLTIFQSPVSGGDQREKLLRLDKSKGFINLGPIEEKKYIQDLIAISADMMLERRIYQKQSRDYAGLDLESVSSLYQKHCNHRDDCVLRMKNISSALSDLNLSNFEQRISTGGLSGYLSQDLIGRAIHLFKLREDGDNRTEKEWQRLEAEYKQVYELVLSNLREVSARYHDELEFAKSNMKELNLTTLDLINKQILMIRNQIHAQKRALIDEIDTRLQRNQELKNAILLERQKLPDLLMEEKKLKMKAELTKGMIQGLSQLIESKMIAKTLSSIESGPLNEPYCTMRPIKSRVLFKGIGLLIFMLGGSFFFFVIRGIVAGIPMSLERLAYQGYRVGGYLGDSLVLRKITQGASGVVGLFGQGGPDYSHDIAKLLTAEGKKTLLIETHFNAIMKGSPQGGLFSYLTGSSEEVSLMHKEGYDYLPMMGRSSFGTELFRSRKFKEMIAAYLKEYEVILLYSSAKLDSGEPEALMEVCHSVSLTLENEKEEMLKPYYDWNQGKNRMIFVACHDT